MAGAMVLLGRHCLLRAVIPTREIVMDFNRVQGRTSFAHTLWPGSDFFDGQSYEDL